ncbi:MAG: T9SS type A sorting domain-containing protein [Bacteroidota bacterium]
MKIILPSLAILAFCVAGAAQAQTNVVKTYGNIQFRANNPLSNFFSPENKTAMFRIPASGNVSSIFASGLWTYGEVQFENYKVAAERYDLEYGQGTGNSCTETFKEIVSLTAQEIEYHRLNYNQPNYQPIQAIVNWPVNNDQNCATIPVVQFHDVDGDRKYNPMAGDYPYIKGDYALMYAKNDRYSDQKSTTNGRPTDLQIGVMVYGYSSLPNTLFVNYSLLNTGGATLKNVKLGLWADIDLGNPADDYIGTFSELNSVYGYNGDANDEVSGGVAPGYGEVPPAQGIVLLNNQLIGSVLVPSTEFIPEGYANLLNGKGVTGTPLSKFAFNGDPFLGSGNTEVKSMNTPGDRQILAVASPGNGVIQPFETACFEIAYVWSRAGSGDQHSSVQNLKADIQTVQAFYDSQEQYCSGVVPSSVAEQQTLEHITIAPNPVTDVLNVSMGQSQLTGVSVFNTMGQEIFHSEKASFSVAQLPAGIYFLKVTTSKGQAINSFIKQ